MRRRHELTDAQWARLEPLPPRKPGAPRKDDRPVVNGILWKLATGAPWRDLPERYGPWPSEAFNAIARPCAGTGITGPLLAAAHQPVVTAG